MPHESNGVDDALNFERQAIATEVATSFLTLFGDVDAAEQVLECFLDRCSQPDEDFWNEVIRALAQVRG